MRAWGLGMRAWGLLGGEDACLGSVRNRASGCLVRGRPLAQGSRPRWHRGAPIARCVRRVRRVRSGRGRGESGAACRKEVRHRLGVRVWVKVWVWVK
eukprot:4281812-Prymnesium_polylepis.1